MPMTMHEIAATLRNQLKLAAAPIGIAFVTEAPEGVATAGDRIPSSCSMWRMAEQGVFYAPPESHFNCPVGALVLGLELPPSLPESLLILALGALATVFVLVRVISIPDSVLPADARGIGIWISLIAAFGVIAGGLLRAAEEL